MKCYYNLFWIIYCNITAQLPFPFWAPTRLDTPDGTIQFNLPHHDEEDNLAKFNNLNSSGFVYEAEAVRQCIIEGK